jgi:hypothetical protein
MNIDVAVPGRLVDEKIAILFSRLMNSMRSTADTISPNRTAVFFYFDLRPDGRAAARSPFVLRLTNTDKKPETG